MSLRPSLPSSPFLRILTPGLKYSLVPDDSPITGKDLANSLKWPYD